MPTKPIAIPKVPLGHKHPRMINKNVTDNVTDNITETDEKKIIRLIKDNPSCTRNDMTKAIGKTVRTVQRILNASTIIKRVGEDYGGHWEVID